MHTFIKDVPTYTQRTPSKYKTTQKPTLSTQKLVEKVYDSSPSDADDEILENDDDFSLGSLFKLFTGDVTNEKHNKTRFSETADQFQTSTQAPLTVTERTVSREPTPGVITVSTSKKKTTLSTTSSSLELREISNDDLQTNSVGLLKLAGCNIYGRMYRVGRIIYELSTPCSECKCTEVGVQCKNLKC